MYAQVEFGLCDEKECISIILDNEEQVNEFMLMLIEKSFIVIWDLLRRQLLRILHLYYF